MQTQEAVAGRALALGLIALRAQYENGISYRDEADRPRFEQKGRELIEWARDQRVTDFLSKSERVLHNKKLGGWEYDEIAERFWRIESMKAVLWCIGGYPTMPTYFVVGDVRAAYDQLPEGKPIATFVSAAKLLPKAAIEKEREFAQFLNWRCRTELLRLQGMEPPRGDSYAQVVARALDAIDPDGFPIEHDGVDILVDGTRFADLGERLGNVMSICYERHLALEWVLSDDDWDDARADT